LSQPKISAREELLEFLEAAVPTVGVVVGRLFAARKKVESRK